MLPAGAAVEITKGGTWQPTAAEIGGLEFSLPLVPYLTTENRPASSGIRIDHPEQYFRQYVAVVGKSKKLIYVNAFCDQIPNWRQGFVNIMDGGTCCWQALYDPNTYTFLTMWINGVA